MENYLGFEMRGDECDFLEGGRVWAVTPGSLYGVGCSHCHGLPHEPPIAVASLAMCREQSVNRTRAPSLVLCACVVRFRVETEEA